MTTGIADVGLLVDDDVEAASDLDNEVFGRLLVLGRAERPGFWVCLCSCKQRVEFEDTVLLGQQVKACGKCVNHRGASWPKYPTSTLDRNWQQFSACLEGDPEAFYQETVEGIAAAKAICAPCPVRYQCLAWGLDLGDVWGVLGGLSAQERTSILKERGVIKSHPETEARIIRAGVRLLATRPLGEVSRSALAAESGLSDTTVKRHFPVIAELRAAIGEAAELEENSERGDQR